MPHMRLKCTHQHGKVWRGVLLINSGENKKTSETVVDSLKFVWTSYKFNYNITTGGLLAHGQDFDESQSLEGAAQYCGWTRKYVKLTRNYRMFFLLQTCHWFIHKEVNAHEKHIETEFEERHGKRCIVVFFFDCSHFEHGVNFRHNWNASNSTRIDLQRLNTRWALGR